MVSTMTVAKEESGRYETVDTIADGAMGTVCLARDRVMDRMVAVKTVNLDLVSDSQERQRLQEALLREAQLVQMLAHPNIVTVHDVVCDGEGQPPSLIMEYVQGTTLDSFLKGGKPLPLDFCIAVVTQIVDALEHAHTMGVVHGDIKPSNILVTDDEEKVKLVDFGISKLLGGETTPTDRLFGTPRYVAPELLAGKEADPRSDLFSLGVVFYEMLTGHAPFAGETATEVTQGIVTGAANLSPQALAEVPEALHAVLRRALERDPSDRYQNATDLKRAIVAPDGPEEPSDTASTQDLSELVVPDLPDVDSVLESGPTDEPPTAPEPAPAAEKADKPRGFYLGSREEQVPIQRLALVAATALATALLIGLPLLWLVTPERTYNARFSSEHHLRAKVLPLLKEGQRLMRSGEPDVAVRLFDRAEELAPGNPRITHLRARASQEARDVEAYRQSAAEIQDLIIRSRAALDTGNSQRALQFATQALSIEPENPEALALADSARSRRARRASTAPPPQKTQPEARAPVKTKTEARPQAVRTTQPRRTVQPAPPRPRPEPKSTSTVSDLRIDVFSYLPKGVLTVYADQDQVLLEPFRFVQKSGFMRKKKTAGRLEKSLRLPAGDTRFRIFVSADGQETQTVSLEAKLLGGQTHVLRLIIAENGSASAQLN